MEVNDIKSPSFQWKPMVLSPLNSKWKPMVLSPLHSKWKSMVLSHIRSKKRPSVISSFRSKHKHKGPSTISMRRWDCTFSYMVCLACISCNPFKACLRIQNKLGILINGELIIHVYLFANIQDRYNDTTTGYKASHFTKKSVLGLEIT